MSLRLVERALDYTKENPSDSAADVWEGNGGSNLKSSWPIFHFVVIMNSLLGLYCVRNM